MGTQNRPSMELSSIGEERKLRRKSSMNSGVTPQKRESFSEEGAEGKVLLRVLQFKDFGRGGSSEQSLDLYKKSKDYGKVDRFHPMSRYKPTRKKNLRGKYGGSRERLLFRPESLLREGSSPIYWSLFDYRKGVEQTERIVGAEKFGEAQRG